MGRFCRLPMTASKEHTPGLLASLRAHALSRFPLPAAWPIALLLAAHAGTASAQFKLQQTFTGTTAPGWTLSGFALLTAPSIDTAGQGWLRLTDTGNTEKGLALDTSESFAGNVPVTVQVGDNTSPATYAGTISGTNGKLVKIGTGTQTLSGANTYTGGTTISAGALVAGVSNVGTTSGAFGPTNGTTGLVTLGDANTAANGSSPTTITRSAPRWSAGLIGLLRRVPPSM